MAYRVNFSARLLDGDNVSSTALAYVSQSGAETLSKLAQMATDPESVAKAVDDDPGLHGRRC